jgi:hypothetical protein
MKKTNTLKIIVLIIGFVLIGLIIIANVSALKLLCLTRGQSVPKFICDHDKCTVCVTDKLNPTNINFCSKMGACSLLGGDSTSDTEAPILTVNSPVNDNIYKTKSVFFDLSANEQFTFYWKDNTVRGNNWRRVASGLTSYKLNLNLKEGFNDLTIRAMDRSGNFKESIVKFYIDSKKPIVKKTFPSKGFSSGLFEVQFSEENPKSVVLNYGNDAVGIRTMPIDLNTCTSVKSVYTCNTSVSVNDYNNQNIRYWFTIIDIGDNSVSSKILTLSVDTVAPVITNQDLINLVGKNAYFNLNISEKNFAGAYYTVTSDLRPRSKSICTKLKDGVCAKKYSFSKKGNYEIEIMVVDKAGNTNIQSASFSII